MKKPNDTQLVEAFTILAERMSLINGVPIPNKITALLRKLKAGDITPDQFKQQVNKLAR